MTFLAHRFMHTRTLELLTMPSTIIMGQDQNSASQPNSTLSPEIFYIHVLESGPYQSSDPLSSSKIDMKNLAPPPYQLEETSPCESSVEKPPNYQISIE
ncbi:uncharacterized protein isoform X3 [Leptinotarsa decemlineata]|uniref:uncharacterized protein isoform X3 n=1 Tax=Leptinotarsa decemlineata TaxID=7539 RepID=UPI000C25508C|nr:uncharacterized protein LOC111518014 isoform X2 [Leptinotarsa decemlineata]